MDDLLPCPFCGGEAETKKSFEGKWCCIECKECNCGTSMCESEDLAFSFWNTRVKK